MKNRILGFVLVTTLCALLVAAPWQPVIGQESAAQVQQNMSFVKLGPSAQGARVLQVGEVNTLSAAVASATTAQVVAAPTAGSIYLRGLWIEKMTTATGVVNVIYGTGTNCGTGTTTLFALSLATGQGPVLGDVYIGVQIPATKALCLQTDATTTSVRALTN